MPDENDSGTGDVEKPEIDELNDVNGEGNDITKLDDPPEKTDEEKAQEADAAKQKKIDDRIAEKHNEKLQAEDRANKAEAELKKRDDEKARIEADKEASFKVPSRPKLPGEYASEAEVDAYHAALDEYLDARDKQADINYRKQAKIASDKLTEESRIEDEGKRRAKDYNEFAVKAKNYGLDKETLEAHEQATLSVLNLAFVENFIVPHEQGGLITQYVSENQDEVRKKIKGMNGMQASAYIEREIVPKLTTTKQKKLSPELNLGGGNAPVGDKNKRRQREGRVPY
jgi:hypothetical protein